MLKLIVSLVVIFLVSSCSTVKVTSNHDTTVDFSTMKTYAWLQINDPLSGDVRGDGAEVKKNVRAAVEKVLMAKGYILGKEDEADFLITWLGAVDKKVSTESIDHFYRPYGYAALHQDPKWKKENSTPLRQYKEGTLLLDFLDPASQKLVWRGVGVDKISGELNPREAEDLISHIVSQILETFPPEKE